MFSTQTLSLPEWKQWRAAVDFLSRWVTEKKNVIALNGLHLLSGKKALIYKPCEWKIINRRGSNCRDVRKLQRFRNQQGQLQKKQLMRRLSLLACYSIVSSSPFLSFVQFICSSHSLSQHLLGLCKYCHCEILQALIDCGWGLIIRASYKDIFNKINATIREAKSLQWCVPLSLFFCTPSFPKGQYLFSFILPPLSFFFPLRFFNYLIYPIEITLGSWNTGVIGCMRSYCWCLIAKWPASYQ